MSEMHAVRYSVRGPPTVLSLETIPVPEPKDDQVRQAIASLLCESARWFEFLKNLVFQVLVKILYAGVNPVDTHLRGPHHPNLVVPLPATPGKDASGTISAVGARASQFKVSMTRISYDQVVPCARFVKHRSKATDSVLKWFDCSLMLRNRERQA